MERPRAYQEAIFKTAKKHNTLVVLPTGLGKTLIAFLLASHRLEKFPDSKILFLAPTRPLVEQHYNYFKKNMQKKYESHIFTGKINPSIRKEIWKNAKIIFSTPQCIENDLKYERIALENVSLLIEDEVHRCLKNYAYVYVAKRYLKEAEKSRLLGLTASPGSDATIIKRVCKNLGIDAVEIRTRESPDVKPYLQKLEKKIVKVELTKELQNIRFLLQEVYKKRVDELKNRKLLFSRATKTNIIDLQKKLQRMIGSGNRHFNILRGVSVCAQAIKLQHLLELIETQGIEASHNYMQNLFEQAEQGKSKAVKQLVNSKAFTDSYLILMKLFGNNIEHPKFEKLKEIIKEEIKQNKELRAIVFSQYRDSVNKISQILESQRIKSKVFIGQAKRKTNGLTQIEQQAILREFKQGKINILVSTSIGEEGLDIPEVDLVIFYEPIPSAIRKIQRTGRTARLKPGKLIILMTKGTRDESYHWAAYHKEKKMYEALEDMRKDFEDNIKEKEQKKINGF
ncbi:MAG: DEAD/DEAH box helicase family protein [Candidatus Pacearchaeota archaeon]|nr:MAG: DEAD/DEAH box helicase family protein [Candidatus Pacearchaeota archaeon]